MNFKVMLSNGTWPCTSTNKDLQSVQEHGFTKSTVTYWSSLSVRPMGHPQRRLFLFGKHRWEHPPRNPRRSTMQRFKNSGCRDEWYEWISMGKCRSMWTLRKPLPVTLFAVEILFVFQSVQYKWSSNSVNANGWGKLLLKIWKENEIVFLIAFKWIWFVEACGMKQTNIRSICGSIWKQQRTKGKAWQA